MQNDLPTFTKVHQQIVSKIESEADEFDIDQMRLAAVLQKRTIIFPKEGKNPCKSSSLVTELLEHPTYRDALLKIGL